MGVLWNCDVRTAGESIGGSWLVLTTAPPLLENCRRCDSTTDNKETASCRAARKSGRRQGSTEGKTDPIPSGPLVANRISLGLIKGRVNLLRLDIAAIYLGCLFMVSAGCRQSDRKSSSTYQTSDRIEKYKFRAKGRLIIRTREIKLKKGTTIERLMGTP
jgi:hypothetical protein